MPKAYDRRGSSDSDNAENILLALAALATARTDLARVRSEFAESKWKYSGPAPSRFGLLPNIAIVLSLISALIVWGEITASERWGTAIVVPVAVAVWGFTIAEWRRRAAVAATREKLQAQLDAIPQFESEIERTAVSLIGWLPQALPRRTSHDHA